MSLFSVTCLILFLPELWLTEFLDLSVSECKVFPQIKKFRIWGSHKPVFPISSFPTEPTLHFLGCTFLSATSVVAPDIRIRNGCALQAQQPCLKWFITQWTLNCHLLQEASPNPSHPPTHACRWLELTFPFCLSLTLLLYIFSSDYKRLPSILEASGRQTSWFFPLLTSPSIRESSTPISRMNFSLFSLVTFYAFPKFWNKCPLLCPILPVSIQLIFLHNVRNTLLYCSA